MKRLKGFTLVELLVVIGIIALLISILLPVLGKVRWAAQNTACTARLRDLTLAVIMYANDNKGALPPAAAQPIGAAGNPNPIVSTSYFQVAMLSTTQFLKTDPGAGLGRLWRTNYLKTSKVFQCPGVKEPVDTDAITSARVFSYYTLNTHVKFLSASGVIDLWWKKLPGYGKVAPSMMYCFTPNGSPTYRVAGITPWRRAMLADSLYAYGSATNQQYTSHVYRNRHAVNMAYADGSAVTYVSDYSDSMAARDKNDHVAQYTELSNAMQAGADGQNVDWRGDWRNGNFGATPVAPPY